MNGMEDMSAKIIEKAEKRIDKALAKIEKKLAKAAQTGAQSSLLDFLGGEPKSVPAAEDTKPAVDVSALEKEIAELKEENRLYQAEVDRLAAELQHMRDLAQKVAAKVDGTIEEVENLMKEAA